jgi:hypothetical protein
VSLPDRDYHRLSQQEPNLPLADENPRKIVSISECRLDNGVVLILIW